MLSAVLEGFSLNKYTFVWRKTVEKNRDKLLRQLRVLLEQVDDAIAQDNATTEERVEITPAKLTEIAEELKESLRKEPKPTDKEGKAAQREKRRKIKEIEKKRDKLEEYDAKLDTLDGRNSCSKTDPDATFMRMKEDAMNNGQTKPGLQPADRHGKPVHNQLRPLPQLHGQAQPQHLRGPDALHRQRRRHSHGQLTARHAQSHKRCNFTAVNGNSPRETASAESEERISHGKRPFQKLEQGFPTGNCHSEKCIIIKIHKTMANQIKEIKLTSINNMAYFNFMKSALERAEGNAKVTEDAAAQVGVLKTKVDALDEVLNLSRKNPTTDKITAADAERDSYYMGYKSAVKGFLKIPSSTMRDAAETLWQNIKDYKIDPKEQLDKETGKLVNLLGDLEEKYSAQVAALGLTAFVENMKTANETVRTLLIERDNAESARIVGTVKTARAETDEAYKSLVLRVNALWVVQYDDAYDTFITEKNEQIARYKQEVIAARKKKEEKGKK